MFFIPTFLRRSFPGHALGQSSLTLFLLLSALGFLVSSYTIDNSCRNYKTLGNDISGDIAQAIQEAQLLASQAYTAGSSDYARANNVRSLLNSLFTFDRRKHATVVSYFESISSQGFTRDFVVICDDINVQFEVDSYQNPPNPIGVFADHRYEWMVPYNDFSPCDPARKPGSPYESPYSYIMQKRLFYLCPSILDKSRGRSLVPYKDQELTGHFIDEFILLPVVLLNDLLYIHWPDLVSVARVQDFPPDVDFEDPNIDVYDPQYLRRLPMVHALGFSLCHKLGQDDPDLAARNCNSVALYALGAYLQNNDWGSFPVEGFALPSLL